MKTIKQLKITAFAVALAAILPTVPVLAKNKDGIHTPLDSYVQASIGGQLQYLLEPKPSFSVLAPANGIFKTKVALPSSPVSANNTKPASLSGNAGTSSASANTTPNDAIPVPNTNNTALPNEAPSLPAYNTPVAEPVTPPSQSVSDENPAENTLGLYSIMGASTVSVEQMVSFFEANGVYPSEALSLGGAPDISAFCEMFFEEAALEGVRAEVAFAQSMKETGWLTYTGDARIEQFNFAGLGTTGGGVQGTYFPDVRTGIRAQIQHLKAYASTENLNEVCVDDRYSMVSRASSPYVEWLGQSENPYGAGWAVGSNYGPDIVRLIQQMKMY